MVSLRVPTFIVTLTARESPTARTMPVCSNELKPCSFADKVYGPTGRFVKTYSPRVPVTLDRVKRVLVWVTVTSTPGSAPPCSSTTVPDNCATATVCANAPDAMVSAITITDPRRNILHRIDPPFRRGNDADPPTAI